MLTPASLLKKNVTLILDRSAIPAVLNEASSTKDSDEGDATGMIFGILEHVDEEYFYLRSVTEKDMIGIQISEDEEAGFIVMVNKKYVVMAMTNEELRS